MMRETNPNEDSQQVFPEKGSEQSVEDRFLATFESGLPSDETEPYMNFKGELDAIIGNAVTEAENLGKSADPEKTAKINKLSQQFKKVTNFLLPMVVIGKLMSPELTDEQEGFLYENRSVAADQLKKENITEERKRAYMPGVSEIIEKGVIPVGYQDIWSVVKAFPGNLTKGEGDLIEVAGKEHPGSIKKSYIPERMDAFRLYLGLPQENNTFGISDLKPESGNGYYYKINDWIGKFSKYTYSQFEKSQLLDEIIKASIKNEKHKPSPDKTKKPSEAEMIKFTTDEIVKLCGLYEKREKQLPMINGEKERLEKEYDVVWDKIQDLERSWKEKNGISIYQEVNLSQLSPKQEKEWKALKESRKYKTLDNKTNEISTQIKEQENKLSELEPSLIHAELGKGFAILTDERVLPDGRQVDGVMGHFKVTAGEDAKGKYIIYTDTWDLGGSKIEREKGLFGSPFKIGDKVYYEPLVKN